MTVPCTIEIAAVNIKVGATIKDIVSQCSDADGAERIAMEILVASFFLPLLAREDRIAAYLDLYRYQVRVIGQRFRDSGIWQGEELAKDCYEMIMAKEPLASQVNLILLAMVGTGRIHMRRENGEMYFADKLEKFDIKPTREVNTMWTDQDLDTLRQGAAAGLSGTQIAMKLTGRTRNAVIGKLHRMGLSTTGQAYWPQFWNAERNRLLLEMVSQGYTQVDMARKFDTTRKAITSHLSRLRRKGKAAPADLSTRYRRKPAKRPEKVIKRFSALTGLPLVGAPKPQPAPKCVARDAVPRKLKFLELQHGHCRFILDEGDGPANVASVYCGADTVGDGSWCGPHRRVVFQPR